VLHASISGISGFVDADGDIHGTTELFERTVVTGTVTTMTGQTPFVRYGEWVLWTCLLALGAAVSIGFWRRYTAVRADRS
jgi:apolipoprotein N-acyltransferase